MNILTVNEEILLLSIWKLKDNAYGVTIRERVMKYSGKKIVYGTLYNSLDNLVKKGYVITYEGEPTSERGGRRKVFYELTETGKEALLRSKELHSSLWEGVSPVALGVKNR